MQELFLCTNIVNICKLSGIKIKCFCTLYWDPSPTQSYKYVDQYIMVLYSSLDKYWLFFMFQKIIHTVIKMWFKICLELVLNRKLLPMLMNFSYDGEDDHVERVDDYS